MVFKMVFKIRFKIWCAGVPGSLWREIDWIRLDSTWFDLIRSDSTWFNQTWFDETSLFLLLIRPDSTWFDLIRFDSVRLDSTKHFFLHLIRLDSTWFELIRPVTTKSNFVRTHFWTWIWTWTWTLTVVNTTGNWVLEQENCCDKSRVVEYLKFFSPKIDKGFWE